MCIERWNNIVSSVIQFEVVHRTLTQHRIKCLFYVLYLVNYLKLLLSDVWLFDHNLFLSDLFEGLINMFTSLKLISTLLSLVFVNLIVDFCFCTLLNKNSPPIFWWSHFFFLYYVFILFCFVLGLLPNVSCVSGLSSLNFPFDFL